MFKIYDGREHFYQWDIDRKLIVADPAIKEVHFCNRTDNCSLVCETYVVDGVTLVDVPNLLLQTAWRIRAYAYDGNYTKHEECYEVTPRTKPSDYVYTETEVKNYDDLVERINQIEENGVSDEVVENAVNKFLTENPITAPVVSVNGKIGEVELTAEDVGALPADTEIPSTAGLASEEFVEDYVANELKTYATKKYVDKTIEEALEDFEPTGGGGSGDVDLSDYYTKKQVDSLIEEIELTPGPAGKDGEDYVLTEADKQEIAGMVEVSAPDVDLRDYYTKTDCDNKFALKTEIPSIEGLATEAYVDEAIANIDIPGGGSTGGSVAIDGTTIIENADGTISTAIGGYKEVDIPETTIFKYEDEVGFTQYDDGYSRFDIPTSYGNNFLNTLDKSKNYPVTMEFRNAQTGETGSCTGYIKYEMDEFGDVNWCAYGLKIFYNEVVYLRYASNYVRIVVEGSHFYQIQYITYLRVYANPTYKYTKIDSNYLNFGDGLLVDGDGVLKASMREIEMYNGTTLINSGNTMTNPEVVTKSIVYGGNNTIQSTSGSVYAAVVLGADNKLSNSNYNIAIGSYNNVTGVYSGAIGSGNNVTRKESFAAGNGLEIGSINQAVYGLYNINDYSNAYRVIIGNGYFENTKRSNGLTIDASGNVVAGGTISNGGADYAEYFEWADGNPNAEDRVGLIVVLEGNKIRLAQAEDEEILGIVSGTATVLGDDAEWAWQGKYLKDEFGRLIVEPHDCIDDNGEVTGQVMIPVINPEYDETKEYISRAKRAEWDAIGMMGKIYLRHDGTACVGDYVAAGADGVATLATGKTNMRVMERISDDIIRILLK